MAGPVGAGRTGIVSKQRIHNGRRCGPTHIFMTDRDKSLTEKGIEDSAEGKMKDLKGKVKDAAGSLTGDTSLEVEGKVDQFKGKAQDTLGKVERTIDERRIDRKIDEETNP